MRKVHGVVGAVAMAAAALAPGMASAQASDELKFDAIVYGWLPTIGGKTSFPAGSGSNINVDANQILDSLKFTFMGTLGAQKGRWGLFADIAYLDVGNSKSATRNLSVQGVELPASVSANASLDLKSAIWTVAGSYRLVADPQSTLDVFAGARGIQLKERLRWEFSANIDGTLPPARSGESTITDKNTDAIVGVKGRYAFGDDRQWFVPYYGDVGGGGSKVTWQGIAGLGYTFRWGELFGAWRYIDYKLKDTKIQEATFNGPAIGVAFHW